MPWSTTLYHGTSFCAAWKATTCSQIGCFSSRKLAEKELVVVITRFWERVFVIDATTGSLIPLSENALLKAFRVASGEKLVFVLAGDLIRMSRFVGGAGFVGFVFCGFLPTRVHSWLLGGVDPELVEAAEAYETGLLELAGWGLASCGLAGWLGWLVGWGAETSALILNSICLVAFSRFATWVVIIEEAV